MLREIIEGGGDGTLCEARLIDGVTDDDVEALFQSARAADYAQIAEAARLIAKTLPVKVKPAEAGRLELEHKIVSSEDGSTKWLPSIFSAPPVERRLAV